MDGRKPGKHRLNLRPASLKFKLTLLVVICWLTPMLVVGGYSLAGLYGSINSRVRESIRYTTDYAGDITMRELQETVNLSRDASYDMNIWDAYQNYRLSRDDLTLDLSINGYLKLKYYFAEDVNLACVCLLSHPDTIYYVSPDGPSRYDYYVQQVHKQALALAQTLGNRIDFIVQGNRIYAVRNLLDKDTFEPYAVLVLQVNPQIVFRDFSGNSLWNGVALFSINGKNGWLGKEQPADAYLKRLGVGSTSIEEDRNDIHFYGKLQPDTDDFTLGYAVTIEKGRLLKSYRNLPLILILLMLALLPLLALVLLFFNRAITRPVADLVGATKALQAGKLGIQVGGVRKDEIGYLATTFNSMSVQINDLIDRIVKEQTASRNSRIMALESQINPHFLNNTLEMMNWRSRLRGDEQLSRMIESLSTILEAGMNRDKKKLIPLREELQHADAYLYIMSMRFGDRLEIHKSIDENTLDWLVPRLMLQPLLENAIVHGMEPVESATLWFTITRENEYSLRIRIRNNGNELTDEEIARLNKMLENGAGPGGRLGMANIAERLRLIYGNAASLRLLKQPDGSTQVEIFVQDVRILLISE